jgi:PBP1b-binding outer membrane lipoprotein LpoB
MKLLNSKSVVTLCASLAILMFSGCDSKTGTPSEYAFSGDETAESNMPPVADAGVDQDVPYKSEVILDASASSDPDGTIVSYEW